MADKKFGVVYTEVIQDPDLSLRAKGLYALLCTYADKNRQAFPSIVTLAELSGVTRRTIERTLNELENKNYVTRNGKYFTVK
jgi:DNA-binding MarR family transcriptional regulator